MGKRLTALCVLAFFLATQVSYGADRDKPQSAGSQPKAIGQSAKSFKSVQMTVTATEPAPGNKKANVPEEEPAGAKQSQEATQEGDAEQNVRSNLETMLLLQQLLAAMRKLTEETLMWLQSKA